MWQFDGSVKRFAMSVHIHPKSAIDFESYEVPGSSEITCNLFTMKKFCAESFVYKSAESGELFFIIDSNAPALILYPKDNRSIIRRIVSRVWAEIRVNSTVNDVGIDMWHFLDILHTTTVRYEELELYWSMIRVAKFLQEKGLPLYTRYVPQD